VFESIGKTVDRAVTLAAENADKSVFPLSLLVVVVCFLMIQGRIDRNDPKLALAPVFADSLVEFGPPARAGGAYATGGRADTAWDFSDGRGGQ
jgi:hypothetical protein